MNKTSLKSILYIFLIRVRIFYINKLDKKEKYKLRNAHILKEFLFPY